MARAGGTLDDVRRRNLAGVLRLVHRTGSVSRAWLTAQTGLNRSTVGDLVAELVGHGLLVETGPEVTNRVGRPSPVVSPHPDVVAVAVNPEVDAVTVAVVGLGARVESKVRYELDAPPTPEDTVRRATATVAGLEGRRVAGVGFAVPGLVREVDGMIPWAPHLGWVDVPLGALVLAASGSPAVVANDATVGALAEHLFGAGRGVDDLVHLNGGAGGIGGGIIVGGRRLGGHGGNAGEFGHNLAAFLDPADRVSESGTVEDEVSRDRLLAALGLRRASDAELAAALAAADEDEIGAEVDRQRRVLAGVLASAANVLDPQLVVLGGYLAVLYETDPAALEGLVAEHSLPAGHEELRIRASVLGDDRLLVGAAELAFGRLLTDPAAAG
jgi:predicted NBD/HSP70 family sugar kinase